MPDMGQRETEIDILLRQSMATPVPRLSAGFHESLSRELRRRPDLPHPFERILLAGYAGVSAVVSVIVMRGQGLSWTVIGLMALGTLGVLEAARRAGQGQTQV